MMWYNYTNIREPSYNPVVIRDGILQRRVASFTCTDQYIPLTREELRDNVSAGDGSYRLVYAINGQIPGPDIVVFEDQVVSVVVRNAMKTETITLHWHGLFQRGTPWMDGPEMISQCPILPGQTFEYRFVASPAGTHWYHGHSASLRSDGLAGALIVLPRLKPPISFVEQPSPDVNEEFIAVLFEWTKRSSTEVLQAYRGEFAVLDEYDGSCSPVTTHPDGSAVLFQLHAGLVNGRGRKYIPGNPTIAEKPYIPLETFTVTPNGYYRFRIINAGFDGAFEISIDEHMLIIVALDGNDVEPYKSDIVVLQAGESVDFIIYAGKPRNNYYINFISTMRRLITGENIVYRKRTFAVLNYQGIDEYLTPIARPRACSPILPCLAVNQVYGLYPPETNTISVPITRLRSTPWALRKLPVPVVKLGDIKQLFFLNFNLILGRGSTINGNQFRKPTSPLQTYPGPDAIVPCGPDTCTDTGCRCTHLLKLGLGSVIEMVVFSFGTPKVAHPVHLHGHHFHVLKIGYPPFDPQTGNSTGRNPDIRCLNKDCTGATWADPSWADGNIPDANLVNPVLKDTVTVPANGYVIIRFKADNPGYWFMHCHFTHHLAEGMSLVMQEGDIKDMAPIPPNFPTCNNFRVDPETWTLALNREEAKLALQGEYTQPPNHVYH
ncbi:uncharacterized protein LOC125665390 [Ostrea edulis]|uniref:uncharacterized protein LOC125665390 n=1 Tax=Ostrea edulis TaxID=37623 RepID=UPI0024AEC55A|nr:uncharacterized protein LOC125665390 [Ostrea edulis]